MPKGGEIYWESVAKKSSLDRTVAEVKGVAAKLQAVIDETGEIEFKVNKKSVEVIDVTKLRVKALANEVSTYRSRLAAGTITETQFRQEMERIKKESIAAGNSLSAQSTNMKKLATSTAQASRALDTLDGKQSKLGLSQQVGIALTNQLGGSLGALSTFANTASIGIGALLLTIGKSTQVAGGFEQSMNAVRAVTNATSEDFQALSDKARELGSTTVFTARETATAMKFLGQAGFDAKEILQATEGTLDLAAAGVLDLGTAADIASNVLTQFGLRTDQTNRVVDVIAKTVTTANTNVIQLADAMNYMGPIMTAFGEDVEVAAAAIGILGNNGLQGTLATRALGTGLTRLTKPTAGMREVMKELNLEFFDANGEFVGLIGLVELLEDRLTGLAPKQQQFILSTLFGNEAIQEINILLRTGSAELQRYTTELQNAGGTAERIANIQLEGLFGSFRKLTSALESLAITLGSVILPLLTALVQALTFVVRGVDSFLNAFFRFDRKLTDSETAANSFKTSMDNIVDAGPDVVSSFNKIKAAIGENDRVGLLGAFTELSNVLTGDAKDDFLEFATQAVLDAETVDDAWTLVWENFQKNAKLALETDIAVKQAILQGYQDANEVRASTAFNPQSSLRNSNEVFNIDQQLGSIADDANRLLEGYFGNFDEVPISLKVLVGDLSAPGGLQFGEAAAKTLEAADFTQQDIAYLAEDLLDLEDRAARLRSAKDAILGTTVESVAANVTNTDPRVEKLREELAESEEQLARIDELIGQVSEGDFSGLKPVASPTGAGNASGIDTIIDGADDEAAKALREAASKALQEARDTYGVLLEDVKYFTGEEIELTRSSLQAKITEYEKYGEAYEGVTRYLTGLVKDLSDEERKRAELFSSEGEDLSDLSSENDNSLTRLLLDEDSREAAALEAATPYDKLIERTEEQIDKLRTAFDRLPPALRASNLQSFETLISDQQRLLERLQVARQEAISKAEAAWTKTAEDEAQERKTKLSDTLYSSGAILDEQYNENLNAEIAYWQSRLATAEKGSDDYIAILSRIEKAEDKIIPPYEQPKALTIGGRTRAAIEQRDAVVGDPIADLADVTRLIARTAGEQTAAAKAIRDSIVGTEEFEWVPDITRLVARTAIEMRLAAEAARDMVVGSEAYVEPEARTGPERVRAAIEQRDNFIGTPADPYYDGPPVDLNRIIPQSRFTPEAGLSTRFDNESVDDFLERMKAAADVQLDYKKSVQGLVVSSRVLGTQESVLADTHKLTTDTIIALLDLGFSPMSDQVQELLEVYQEEKELLRDKQAEEEEALSARQAARQTEVDRLIQIKDTDSALVQFGKGLLGLAIEEIPALGAAIQGYVNGGPIGAIVAVVLELLSASKEFSKFFEIFGESLFPVINALGGLLGAFLPIIEALGTLNYIFAPFIDIITNLITPPLRVLGSVLKFFTSIVTGVVNGLIAVYNFLFGWLFGRVRNVDDPSRRTDPNEDDDDTKKEVVFGETYTDDISALVGKPSIGLSAGTPSVGTAANSQLQLQAGQLQLQAANIQIQAANLQLQAANQMQESVNNFGRREYGGTI